jgi:hypothetical protein
MDMMAFMCNFPMIVAQIPIAAIAWEYEATLELVMVTKGLYLSKVFKEISEGSDEDKEGILPNEGELEIVTGEEKGMATRLEFGVKAGMHRVTGDFAIHKSLVTYGRGIIFGELEMAQ